MLRLRNERTGVVVNVDDATAAALNAGTDSWASTEESKKAPAKRAASSKKS